MAKAKYKCGVDGYYRARVWDGTYNADGTKHRMHLKSNKSSADLEKQVNALKQKVANRELVQPTDSTFIEYARYWFRTYKSIRSDNTQAMYERIIEKHLAKLGYVKLQDIRRVHFQTVINDARNHPRTCTQIRLTFNQIIKCAMKERLLPRGAFEDICEDIDTPRYIVPEKRPLTAVERKALREADFSLRERCFMLIIYGCGLRKEEALALRPEDILLEKKKLYVRRALIFKKNDPVIKETKSRNGVREVPLPDYLCKFLYTYLQQTNTEFLIEKTSGGGMTKSSYRKMWESILKKMRATLAEGEEINGLTAHVFRHNYCTQLCYQIPKISIKKVAQLMGDTEKVILDVYNHIIEEKESVFEVVESAVSM